MMTILLIAVGGGTGSVLRYLVGTWALSISGNLWMPYGTLTVNVVGSLLIGLIAGVAETHEFLGEGTRTLVVVGLLGGFTTFSAFGLETITMAHEGHLAAAGANVGIQVTLALIGVWIGFTVSRIDWTDLPRVISMVLF